MFGKFLTRDYFAPAAAVLALSVMLLVGALFFLAKQADDAARAHEEAVVANGLNVRIAEIASTAYAVLGGDPGGVSPNMSAERAREELGAPLAAAGFDAAIVIDGAGRAFYVMEGGSASAVTPRVLISSATALTSSVRTLQAARGTAGTGPLQASAGALIGDQAYIITATATRARSRRPSPILITADAVDDNFVAGVIDRFLLDDLHVHVRGEGVHAGAASVPLTSAIGNTVAVMEWRPRKPGQQLLRQGLPGVLLVIAALGALAFALYQRGRRAAKKLVASEARATHLAYHDALTGLPNRLMLMERLELAIEGYRRHGTRFAVHCIDLDRFKEVNDTFGHQAGDELIRLAARKIGACARQLDTVARLGGDEFAVVQVGVDADGAGALAERIVATLTEPMELSVGRVHIGASVGVMLGADSALDPAECLRQSDLALYRVKENGRGRYCFFEQEMDANVRFRRDLQADLREAIAHDQLSLVYQPQVDGYGRIVGLEALARWTHTVRGPISPGIFIPLAEECGLIDALGMFTLRRAFADSRRWPGLKIAVNISATQVRQRSFPEKLEAAMKQAGVDASRFELEITEGVLLGDDPNTHATLRRIRELGFSLALDDFGTGYSSLAYLQRYPIDKIKIDRSFVTNLGVEHEADSLINAIVRLARALNLGVVAEGVETNEQRLRLAQAGCSEVQGFLCGRPMPADEVDALVLDQAPMLSAARAG